MARKYLGGSGQSLTVWISVAASTVLIFYGYDQGERRTSNKPEVIHTNYPRCVWQCHHQRALPRDLWSSVGQYAGCDDEYLQYRVWNLRLNPKEQCADVHQLLHRCHVDNLDWRYTWSTTSNSTRIYSHCYWCYHPDSKLDGSLNDGRKNRSRSRDRNEYWCVP